MSLIKNYYVILGCDSYIMIVLDFLETLLSNLGRKIDLTPKVCCR